MNMGSHIPLIYLFGAVKGHYQVKSGGMRETKKMNKWKFQYLNNLAYFLLVIIMEVAFLAVKIMLETKTMIYSLFFRCHKKRNGCKGN